MSWITELSKVYDNTTAREICDRPEPIYCISNLSSVTITIDGDGNFLTAKLEKNAESTLMPCMNPRTSGVSPYPLCDVFAYVAGFSQFDKKYIEKKDNEKKKKKFEATAFQGHQLYLKLLSDWAASKFSNFKIIAVEKYVKKQTVGEDLRRSGFSESDFSDFIRWRVEIPGGNNPCLWKDPEIFESWEQYYNSLEFDEFCKENFDDDELGRVIRRVGLDYVTGKLTKLATSHPKKIRNAADGAKLISSNDKDNFTFRGRFLTDSEACQISSEATQKAHSALRWLIKNQGVAVGDGLSVVVWNQAGDDFPPLTAGSTDLLPVKSGTIDESSKEDDFLELDFDEPDEKEEPQGIYSTSSEFASAMNKRLLGYYGDISKPQNIMVMAIKEATPGQGRASIILYRELQNSDMLKALESWHNRLSWYLSYWEKKSEKGGKSRLVRTVGTPSPKTIAECAYGERVKANLVEKTVQRILPCILDGGVIPSDLETQCVRSASNLLAVESYRRDIVLETACAVYKYNHHKEDFKLALEENRTSRDYLFGRLLAVEQQYENAALRKAGQERETNAVRYMQQFSMHPSKTWLMLYKDKLPAYRRHLEPGLVNWFEKQIQDISALFKNDDYMNDKPLSGEFLLGYQCQLKAFRKNTDDSSEENTEE